MFACTSEGREEVVGVAQEGEGGWQGQVRIEDVVPSAPGLAEGHKVAYTEAQQVVVLLLLLHFRFRLHFRMQLHLRSSNLWQAFLSS